jgi:hypothetical protein
MNVQIDESGRKIAATKIDYLRTVYAGPRPSTHLRDALVCREDMAIDEQSILEDDRAALEEKCRHVDLKGC